MIARTIRPLDSLRRFLHWWTGELIGLVPAWLRHRFVTSADRLVLSAGDRTVRLWLEVDRETRPLGAIDLRSGPEPRQSLAAVLRDRGLDAGRLEICVRMPAEQALRKVIDLPTAAESNLDEVVSFELDRHTPFKAEQVLSASRVVGRDARAQTLSVEVTLVPRQAIDQARAVADLFGLSLDRLDVAREGGASAASGDLLPTQNSSSRRHRAGRVTYGLAILAVVLASVAIYLPIARARRDADDLARKAAALRQSAVAAAALRKDIDDLRKTDRFLIDRRRAVPTVSALLFETTHLLPDDTWLSDWRVSGREMQLEGVARSASALVGLLEDSHAFKGTTFLAPVTPDPITGGERFHIAAQILEGGSP